jgi:hypothetical protein
MKLVGKVFPEEAKMGSISGFCHVGKLSRGSDFLTLERAA